MRQSDQLADTGQHPAKSAPMPPNQSSANKLDRRLSTAAPIASPEVADRPVSCMGTLLNVWSSTSFSYGDLSIYAEPHIAHETRDGVAMLSLAALVFSALAALLSSVFALGDGYVYTYFGLAALALHIHLYARRVVQIRALHLLAMLLLIVCGSSLVLLTQQSGQLSMMLLLSVTVLFMLVPVVPWGLREAALTTGAIYLMFTASTFLTRVRFTSIDLWVLQFLMLVAAVISLALVARALGLRKHDLHMRFALQQAHTVMVDLANRDPLTGAWNRRYLEREFNAAVAAHHASGVASYFGLFDIDGFKITNDTYGHRHGDDVLKAVQRAFSLRALEGDYLVRLGGDEFALLMAGDGVAQRLRDMLSLVAGLACGEAAPLSSPTMSVGLVRLLENEAPDFDRAYKMADALLYDVKRSGGNNIRQNVPLSAVDRE